MGERVGDDSRAELRQRAIEASDNSMFKYLSFFAAIHAAAITAIASESVGLPALRASPDAVVPFVVLATTGSLGGLLCLVIGRGLHDAAVQHKEAVRYGSEEEDPGTFFDRIYGETTGGTRNPINLLSGGGRLFPRHVRIGGAVLLAGMFWGVFLLDIATSTPHLLIGAENGGIEGIADEAAAVWGGVLVIVGAGLLVQMLLEAWKDD